MSRDLPTDLETAIDEPVVRPFLAVRIELPDPVYAWTGRGIINFDDADSNNRDWIGAGELGSIDTVGEATDGSATGIRVALNQIPSEFREDIAQQAVRGGKFEVYVGSLNETYQTVEATVLLNRYKVDQYKVTDGGTSLSVEVAGESRAIDQRRPAIKRFTNEYQQRVHPGDKFLEYVSKMTEVSILWAQAESGAPGPGGASPGQGGGISSHTIINSV
jgi:hypothetical protein